MTEKNSGDWELEGFRAGINGATEGERIKGFEKVMMHGNRRGALLKAPPNARPLSAEQPAPSVVVPQAEAPAEVGETAMDTPVLPDEAFAKTGLGKAFVIHVSDLIAEMLPRPVITTFDYREDAVVVRLRTDENGYSWTRKKPDQIGQSFHMTPRLIPGYKPRKYKPWTMTRAVAVRWTSSGELEVTMPAPAEMKPPRNVGPTTRKSRGRKNKPPARKPERALIPPEREPVIDDEPQPAMSHEEAIAAVGADLTHSRVAYPPQVSEFLRDRVAPSPEEMTHEREIPFSEILAAADLLRRARAQGAFNLSFAIREDGDVEVVIRG